MPARIDMQHALKFASHTLDLPIFRGSIPASKILGGTLIQIRIRLEAYRGSGSAKKADPQPCSVAIGPDIKFQPASVYVYINNAPMDSFTFSVCLQRKNYQWSALIDFFSDNSRLLSQILLKNLG